VRILAQLVDSLASPGTISLVLFLLFAAMPILVPPASSNGQSSDQV
jgi:hypothetical protein